MKNKVDEAMKNETNFREKAKTKINIRPNKKITEKAPVKEEKVRPAIASESKKDMRDLSFTNGADSKVGSLEIGLIDKQPKHSSIFTCCNKLLMFLKNKKKKSLEDDEQ